jgi:hypothetical protein
MPDRDAKPRSFGIPKNSGGRGLAGRAVSQVREEVLSGKRLAGFADGVAVVEALAYA